MAVKVKNLELQRQSGTDNSYYASWDAPVSTVTTTTAGSLKKGDLVSIKTGATYYNGVKIPSWVMAKKWYVLQVKGDRVVINKSEDGKNAIMSAINIKYLSGGSGSSSSTSEEKVSNVDNYKVVWKYATDDGVWFSGSSGTVATDEERTSVYNPPENAARIGVWVTPVAKNDESKKTPAPYWTGEAVSITLYLSETQPVLPSNPSVEVDKFTLTATVTIDENDEANSRTDEIEFSIVKNDQPYRSGVARVMLGRAIFTCQLEPASEYRVRCRAINSTGGKSYSGWTNWVGPYTTIPHTMTDISCVADSKTSLKVSWGAVPTATSYTVEYTTNKEYFDSSSNVSSMTVENTVAYITGLESGNTWFVRVKATNKEGDSGWSGIASAILGTKPEPPTTWSLSNTACVGEDIILYWTHNSEDGSKQTEANLYIEVNGTAEYIAVSSSTNPDDAEPIYSYTIHSDKYVDGGYIKWMVQTKGVADEFSDWSTQRTIDIFAPPTVVILHDSLTDGSPLTAMPLEFTTMAGPVNQTPISYHVSVVAVDAYETVDNIGNTMMVSPGDSVYSKIVVSSEREINWVISAGDITLESGHSYLINVSVSMNSGLIAEGSVTIQTSWDVVEYISDASIAIDEETLAAYITPFCLGEGDVLIENVALAVYRRESDGSFTEIASNLENTMVTTVTDPHPSLDYARYRIVTTDLTTGKIDYSDLPGIPVEEHSIIIQWDEQWQNFDYNEEGVAEDRAWAGSMVRLPYNIEIGESHAPDVSLVEYVGRKHPVSYYGTQRGESGSWSTEIDKNDKETLYALRRLAAWNGDVYVREPSGIGYWAQITVNMSTKYSALTIPVKLEVTRVEGGI